MPRTRILGRLMRASTGIAFLALAARAVSSGTPTVAPVPCRGPEYRRLDFWIGDWDAYEVGGSDKPVARAHVSEILGGCALREVYEQTDGLVGESLTVYDSSRDLWHQTWVTNRGRLLAIEGRFQGSRLILQGPHLADGQEVTLQGVWSPEDGGVRETARTSANGGATWQPLFDLVFRRHAAR